MHLKWLSMVFIIVINFYHISLDRHVMLIIILFLPFLIELLKYLFCFTVLPLWRYLAGPNGMPAALSEKVRE